MGDDDDGPRAEYLRVINRKDTEIQRLMMANERAEMELRKEQERSKAKVNELRAEIESMRRSQEISGSQESQALKQMKEERDALRADVATLRDELQRQEDHMHGVLKAAKKAEKAEVKMREKYQTDGRLHYAELEERLAHAHGRIDSLVQQREEDDRELGQLRREAERLREESDAAKKHTSEAEENARELRLRTKDMLSKATVSTEVKQLESRHNTILGGLEREISRLRDEARERALQSGRQDALIADYRRKIDSMETELTNISRRAQEQASESAMDLLRRQQTHEETRGEFQRALDHTKDQLERALADRGQLESELVLAQRRIQELESCGSIADRRFDEERSAMQKDIFDLRQKVQMETTEAAEAKRRCDVMQEDYGRMQAKVDAAREQGEAGATSLKQQLKLTSDDLCDAKDKAKRATAEADMLRKDLADKNAELVRDRNNWRQTETELRDVQNELRGILRSKDDEREHQLRRYDSETQELQNTQRQEMNKVQAEHRAMAAGLNSQVKMLTNDVEAANAVAKEHAAVIERLQQALDAKGEKERSLLATIRELDDEARTLKFSMAERDGAIATLKRSVETLTASLTAARNDSENKTNALDTERRKALRFEEQMTSLVEQLNGKQKECEELTDSLSRLKRNYQQVQSEFETVSTALKSKNNSLQADNANLEVALNTMRNEQARQAENHRNESARLEQRHADECNLLQREVLSPLQDKVEALVAMNDRLHSDLQDREQRLSEMAVLQRRYDGAQADLRDAQNALQTKDRRLAMMESDLGHEREQGEVLVRVQRERASEQEDLRRLKLDNESLMRKIGTLEATVESATREAVEGRSRDSDMQSQLQAKRSELSAVKERCANLESLKTIAEKAATQAQQREQELQDRMEDLRNSYQTLQTCFDKQQEQLDNAQRMREKDLERTGRRNRGE